MTNNNTFGVHFILRMNKVKDGRAPVYARIANRYVIYQAISEKLSLCKNLNDLQHQLKKLGIETLLKYKGQTDELQG